MAHAKKFLVAILAVKLVLAYNIRPFFTNATEDVVVQVKGTFINTGLLLPLAAHAENRFEFMNAFHF